MFLPCGLAFGGGLGLAPVDAQRITMVEAQDLLFGGPNVNKKKNRTGIILLEMGDMVA